MPAPTIRNKGTSAGTAASNSRLAKPGQFANLIPKQLPNQQFRLSGKKAKPQFITPNGSNALAGPQGQFGSMLPVGGGASATKKIGLGLKVPEYVSNIIPGLRNAGVSISAPIPKLPERARISTNPVGMSASIPRVGFGVRVPDWVKPSLAPQYRGEYGFGIQTPERIGLSIPSLSLGYGGTGKRMLGQSSVNMPRHPGYGQVSETPESIRRQQINQLTGRYTGSLAAITGANMVEPVNRGFPGTHQDQPVPVSDTWGRPAGMGAKIQGVPWSDFADTYGNTTAAVGGGGRRGGGGGGGYGYDPYGYSDPYSYGGNYGSTPYSSWGDPVSNILNWRVATG